jgi:hypothetical protein
LHNVSSSAAAGGGQSFSIPADAVGTFKGLVQQMGVRSREEVAVQLKETEDDWVQPFTLEQEELELFKQVLPVEGVAGMKGLLGQRQQSLQVGWEIVKGWLG